MKKIQISIIFFALLYLFIISAKINNQEFLNQPLVTEIYTADPSAHLFNNKIYVYPSHDIEVAEPDLTLFGLVEINRRNRK